MITFPITIHPQWGQQALFEVGAASGLTTGKVFALQKKETAEDGFLALVESAVIIPRETAREVPSKPENPASVKGIEHETQPFYLTRVPWRFGTIQQSATERVIWTHFVQGTLRFLASFEKNRIAKVPPQRPSYGQFFASDTPARVLEEYYGTIYEAYDSKGREFKPTLSVGHLLGKDNIPVVFNALGFMRHTAVFGQSGSGKSNALGVLIEQLLTRTRARVVVIDPNGDFKDLDKLVRDNEPFGDEFRKCITDCCIKSSRNPAEYEEALGRLEKGDLRGIFLDLNSLDRRLWADVLTDLMNLLWTSRDKKVPTVMMIDEAHNFAPEAPVEGEEQLLYRLLQIAGEGRKYGLWLILASQRPQKVHSNIISQCDNLIVMKLTSRDDISHIASGFNATSREMVELSYGFEIGEALAVGKIVRSPVLLKFAKRRTKEGGGDVSNDWAQP